MSINKTELFNKCLDKVNELVEQYKQKMETINGYNAEHKMHPDYHEYGNKGELMSKFEEYARHRDHAQEMKETLANLDRNHKSEVVRPGSIVETTHRYYYISVPLGEIYMDDGSEVFAISEDAPIYEHLGGKKAGHKYTFNGESAEIKNVL